MSGMILGSIVDRLQGDWNFVEKFLDDPEEILNAADLTDEQRAALATRDVDELIRLGVSKELIINGLSGAHTPTCSGIKQCQIT